MRKTKVTSKWDKIYPNAMKRWADNWDVICPIFKFSAKVRRALYTTNAIESLNSQYRRINAGRPVFPSDEALKKPCSWLPATSIKNGQLKYGIGARYTVSFLSPLKVDCKKSIDKGFAVMCASQGPAPILLLTNKVKVGAFFREYHSQKSSSFP